jgi:ATP-binding cassette subfamily B protein RaxB
MIASAHGLNLDMGELRRRFAMSLKGATLAQLMAHGAALGFVTRPLRAELSEIVGLEVPCILHWDLHHFVVLKKVVRRRSLRHAFRSLKESEVAHLVVLDPAIGERRLTLEEASPHFTGVALELSPGADFQPQKPAVKLRLSQLTGRVRGLKGALAQIFALACVLELFALVSPLFNQLVIDEVLTSGDRELLTVLTLGFALLLLIQSAIGLARSWMVMVLGQTLGLQWTGNVFAHLIRLPIDYFERRHLGDVVSRFGSVGLIQRALTTAVIEAMLDGIMAIAALVMMLIYGPTLAAVTVVAVLLYGLVRLVAFKPFREAAAERLTMAAKENSHFIETLRAVTPIKLFCREQERRARWQNLVVDVQNRDVRTAKMNIAFSTANTLIFGIENLLVFWFGARMVMDGRAGSASVFTIGMLFAYLSYKSQFTSRVSALINYGVELRMLGLHTERLADIALTRPEQDNPAAEGLDANAPAHDLGHLQPTLELRNVSFRYAEGEPWILKDANFSLRAGESVAVTGTSGCGKTTLLKILLGLLTPTQGEILYGGIPVRQLGMANVRMQFGAVMQDDVLLSGNLMDNISFFDVQPDEMRVESCARHAQIFDDVAKMPMGFRTVVGDMGSGLSGGQKQRLMLARALYKRPRILVLDEATSHLDVPTERAVTQTLGQLGTTRIVVAHRPETIAAAGRVVMMKDGVLMDILQMLRTAVAERPADISATALPGAAGRAN